MFSLPFLPGVYLPELLVCGCIAFVYNAEAHADTFNAEKTIPQYLAQVCHFLLSGSDMIVVFYMLQLETFGSFNRINFIKLHVACR